jgi:putative ABC transport system permease protein
MTFSAILPLLILVGMVLLAVVWQMARRPVQRRYATRDVVRRPGESALVIAGSLLGTALIAGSFIVGDTLDASVKQRAWTQLGPVDEVVTVGDPRRAEEIVQLLADAGDPLIDGVMSLTTASASVASDARGKQLAEPGAQVIELDFEQGRDFGGDPAATGMSGPTPADGEVVVTEDLASEIGVGPGDDVVVHLYGSRVELTVDRVVAQEGLAGFWTGFETDSPNAFVPLGTLASATGAGVAGDAVAPAARVVVSNKGGVEEGAAHSDTVRSRIEGVLSGRDSLRVDTVKSDLLDRAEAAGENLGSVFLTLGIFAIIAGVLLLVNIFVMLAEERKGQLGMLRAIGTRRSDLVRIFFIEGAMYSLAASAAGAGVGIGVGWAIVKVAAPIFSELGDSSLDFRFHAEMSSIIGGFCIGMLISMATIVVTSVRISRINIIRAIRDLPEPNGRKSRPRTLVAGSILAVAAAGWFFSTLGDMTAWAPALLGPPITFLGLVPIAGRLVGRRPTVLIASAFGLAWGTLGNTILDGQMTENGDIAAFVVQGVLLVFSAVVLLTQLQENFEGVIRRFAAPRLSLRLGLAYPLARRFRTGLTLGMFSLVIFTLVMVGVLASVFGGQVATATDEEAGGYDILVTAAESNPPGVEELAGIDGVERVVATNYGTPLFEVDGFSNPTAWPATGITPEFTEVGPPKLAEFATRFDNQQDAWAEVTSNSNIAIVSSEFLQQGGPPENEVGIGDEIGVIDPVTGRTTTREVVGLTETDEARSGAYMSFESLEDVLGKRAAVSHFYVVASGSLGDAGRTASTLQGRFVANGVEAETFRSIVEEGLDTQLQFMRLLQGYLALGLVVGIAGLGVVMVRAVRDRRREIGVLRALGFVPRNVRSAFLLESTFVSLEGILVGTSLALVTASQLISSGEFGESATFSIPWFQLALVCISVFVASLAATARPAQKASKIPPAVALRIAE